MTNRKLEALRALAERPGTEHEGVLARELLARFEKYEAPDTDREDFWKAIDARTRGEMSEADFHEALLRDIKRQRDRPIPTHWTCACGVRLAVGQKCQNHAGHDRIQREIQKRFKKGERVFYNAWAYAQNDPAIVQGYVRSKFENENGSHPWAWIRLRFDTLKTPRNVPIRSRHGWHLSHEPLPLDEARKMGRP